MLDCERSFALRDEGLDRTERRAYHLYWKHKLVQPFKAITTLQFLLLHQRLANVMFGSCSPVLQISVGNVNSLPPAAAVATTSINY